MTFRKLAIVFTILTAYAWTDANAVFNAKHSHTTTLLADGNILITGGVTDSGNAVTAEIQMYNMSTNAFEAWAGNLVTARSSHTATLMSDGRVLIAGGFAATGTPLSSMELCNPKTRTCAATTAMSTLRGGHTATLLTTGPRAGRVLICGGQSAAAQTSVTGACDIYNPSDASVFQAAAFVSPRIGHAAVTLESGKVFVTGGRRRNAGDTAWIYEPMNELYDPAQNVWTPVSALLQGRINHTATVLNNGLIMIAGGYNALDVLTCRASGAITDDECWHILGAMASDAGIVNQTAGSKGFLGGAEVFDRNGARAVLGESVFGVTPYRVNNHSALLLPDGVWHMSGGYGNIVPTFFRDSPTLSASSVIYLTKTGPTTANVNPGSVINFLLDIELSREVSGRLVNADAFFSRPATPASPSIATDNVEIALRRSTAVLDGLPVGTLIGEGFNPGQFFSYLTLQNPAGTAVFDKSSLNSGAAPNYTSVITSTLTMTAPVYPLDTNKLVTGSINTWLSFTLPDIYRGIKGTARVLSGSILDDAEVYNINLEEYGSGPIDVFAPVSCDSDTNSCLYVTSATFTGLRGRINNMTPLDDGTTVYSPLETAGDTINMNLEFAYTADEIHMLDRAPVYSFDVSTLVVREMVLSSQLGYLPRTNSWKDLADVEISPTLTEPAFNHTAIITPAADAVILGGRNCEPSPAAQCARGVKTFSATSNYNYYIPVFKSPVGDDIWPEAPKLNSKRAYHTSTLLFSGHILTCGGSDGATQLATCEMMDPETRQWTPTGTMTTPRTKHTATLLPNGSVLVAGGVTPSSAAVAGSEIFYPDTQRWVPTSSMGSPRQNHTATLLPDGNVLVAGGSTISTYSATAELYISSKAYWLPVGSMATPRAQHTATLLKDGNVLMVGGVNGFGAARETEIYSHVNKTFSAGPDLNTPRYTHTATLLKDGNVLVIGGSNNSASLLTSEIFNGAAWGLPLDPNGDVVLLNLNRSSHRSVLLPNGKVMVTGGESAGVAQGRAESFDPDFYGYADQGQTTSRSHHTTILTRDNHLINIGGWDGGEYLDTTETAYFSYYPDLEGLSADTTRQMLISTATVYFDRGMAATLLSDASNFHGITEASGGGAGAANSSHHNPRVYMHQIDNPSGFMIDLSTRIYSWYGGPNTNWETTLSSITIITPSLPGEMPHGWYHMRVAGSGVFSDGQIVQVTVPRPSGTPSAPTGSVQGVSSITWSWTSNTVTGADAYALYSSSDNVFITTATFLPAVSYTQTGLQPNTQISVKVNATNVGGGGAMAQSATYYTLAMPPTNLAITGASFTSASLAWNANANSPATPFELSMCAEGNFNNPVLISTPIPFNVNFTSTYTTLSNLSPNKMYYFRVKASNGAGVVTAYSNVESTITVAAINDLSGTAVSTNAINWAWSSSLGADYYEVYDVSAGTEAAVFIGSTTLMDLTQTGLSANRPYTVSARAVKSTAYGPVSGPPSAPMTVYTLAVAPSAHPSDPFISVTTGSFTVNWLANGNSTWTVYSVHLSTASDFARLATSSSMVVGESKTFGGLGANVRYYIKLYAINGSGIASDELNMGTKYTLARPPYNVTPASIDMSGVTLSWEKNNNSAGTVYEVRGTTSSFSNTYTTYLPFSRAYTGDSHSMTGLLTSTTYYFDVAARNGEGLISARQQSVPAAFTLAGPNNAPAGSIAGVTSPSAATVITGWLPNTRQVSLSVPAGSFAQPTAIAISSSVTNSCGSYTVCGRTMEVAVFSENGAQPQVPVSLELGYECTIPDISKLVMARYNPVSGQCLPLETKIDPGTRK
ncbi:MAG: fibronectin type III domain-containing protein, partial [Elusimicrobiales bacterium]|nr:fibronectin type III domain-containing protein [Elusimicrobiales bacterium]